MGIGERIKGKVKETFHDWQAEQKAARFRKASREGLARDAEQQAFDRAFVHEKARLAAKRGREAARKHGGLGLGIDLSGVSGNLEGAAGTLGLEEFGLASRRTHETKTRHTYRRHPKHRGKARHYQKKPRSRDSLDLLGDFL